MYSFVNPSLGVGLPLDELSLGEPESDLGVGRLDGIGTVNDVAADIDAEVATDGAWGRVERLGGTEHLASSKNSVVTFPDHGADRARCGVVNESLEEALG